MDLFKVPVIFHENMNTRIKLPSPSAGKPEKALADWQRHQLNITLESWHELVPVTANDLKLAHDPEHVRKILALEKANGFDTKDREVAESVLWTTGSMLCAAKEALTNKKVACSPTSGFHHAGFDQAWGFCTFNGLMVTVQKLFKEKWANRIGILDCDQHYGDGTDDIIKKFHLQGRVVHISASEGYPRHAEDFLSLLPHLMEGFKSCDLLLYQAGADCHIKDPLGGFLSADQMRQRDAMVFEACKAMRMPCVWNLAGGYQELQGVDPAIALEPVLALHRATMEECCRVFGNE